LLNPIESELQNSDFIKEMMDRAEEVESILCAEGIDSSWTLGLTYLGITTHYKLNHSSSASSSPSNITVRMEGTLEIPIFEQCSVIHEVDLYPIWMPFCSEGKTIDKIGQAELIPYICISVPPISRDLLLRAYAADCLQEYGKVVITGTTIDSWKDFEIPFKQTGWLHKRMTINKFQAIFHVLSPNLGKVSIDS